MDRLPIFLDLKGRACAVVGGGEVAARKVSLLLAAGGQVTVTAPALCQALRAGAAAGRIAHRAAAYEPAVLDDAILVIAATNDRAVNAAVSRDAQARQLPVNVVDDPELCSFIMPAIVDRSPMIVLSFLALALESAFAAGSSCEVPAGTATSEAQADAPTARPRTRPRTTASLIVAKAQSKHG